MTKKDYTAIAEIVYKHTVHPHNYTLIIHLCELFSADNPSFDCVRFKKACGYQELDRVD